MNNPVRSHTPQTDRAATGLPAEALREIVERALQEDVGAGDLTTRLTVREGIKACGTFIGQQDLVVAGLAVAVEVFRRLDPSSVWHSLVEDGAEARAGTPLAAVRGPAAALLSGERVALNFLQRLSGIATLTRRLKEQLGGLDVEVLDTRKTTPGLRALEKYAVRVGGGRNHRMGLEDGILIKNNHLRLAGGVRASVENARRNRPPEAASLALEVEVASLRELDEAIAAGADVVLLDNMTQAEVAECVKRAQSRVRLEVSGGIHLQNIRAYARTGVDFISVGALTHSAPAAQIHFVIEPV